ncbi:hypothetical protein [Methylocella tundrae]|uniref:hypothetical protein n=1 Tax=Methylocella tundrae TaxID=227605 RepID=UPI00157B6757|nr:hypothetical protein [Methylocella tundrae]
MDWFERVAQPSAFRMEFIGHIDGQTEPEIPHKIEGLFKDLNADVDEGSRLWSSIHDARGAVGFRVAQGDGSWIAHRFCGDSRLGR